ncbi:MAG: hypothetical protein KJ961_17110, partial [Alphaproteobacteria bacterium]|nr:hypothetical protein [Alphaproteobacteria bacterium]
MSQTPPLPDDDVPHGALIEEGGRLVRWLITEMRALFAGLAGQPPGLAWLRRLARQYIIPAEAVLRRAVHLIADTLPPLEPSTRPRGSVRPRAGGGPAPQARKPRAPVFRLTEPLSRPPTNYLPVNQRHRISVAGDAPPPPAPPPRKPDPARLQARLLRRLAAAERLLRLRARTPRPAPALAFHKIPGLKAEPLRTDGQRILQDLNT